MTRTGSELRQQLGAGELSSAQAAALRAVRPSNPKLAELYANGLDKLRRFDAMGARRLLERVVSADPDYPLGRLALSEVFNALGYDERARSEVQQAFMLSSSLPREERYLIEARYRQSNKEWDKAFAAYRSLLGFFPESIEYGLYLARAQLAAGQPEAALATTQKLRQLPAPASQDPRLDLVAASANGDRGDYPTALQLFDRAAQKGAALGAPLLVAAARIEIAYTLNFTGQREAARKSAEQARDLFVQAGNRGGVADALMAIGQSYTWQCNYQKALEAEEAALAILIDIENSGLLANMQANMSLLLGRMGQLKLSLARAEGSLILSREIGAKEAAGGALIAIGWVERMQGRLRRAGDALEQANIVFTELGDPRMVAWYKWHKGQLLVAQDRLSEAQSLHAEALQIREQNGLAGFAAESKAALAYLALERSDLQAAERLARQAAEQFQKDGQLDEEARALSLLSTILWQQGKRITARATVDNALRMAEHMKDPDVSAKALSAAAKIYAGSAKKEELLPLYQSLEQQLKDVQSMGMVPDALELRISLGLIDHALGRHKLAQERLSAVDIEAAGMGLMHLSKKSRAILNV